MADTFALRQWTRHRAFWAAGVVIAAIAVALLATRVAGTTVNVNELILGLALTILLATRRATWTLAVIGAMAMFGWNPEVVAIGPTDLRALDLPFLILLCRLLFNETRPKVGFEGARYVYAILGVTGFATLYVYATSRENFAEAASTWLRLVATVALIWLTAASVRSRREFAFVVRALVLSAMAAVGYAVVVSSGRAAAFGGPNTLGLVSGMLVLAGLHASAIQPRILRVAAAGAGLVGLVASRSIASIVATGIAIVVGGLGTWSEHRRPGARRDAGLRTWSRVVVAAVLAFMVVSALRPVDLPGSKEFGFSSAAVRLSVGYAGLEIFQAHPVFGVGWAQSSVDGVINAPSVVEAVERRFTDLRTYSETDGGGVTTVHNMYVQFLAEMGLIGVVVLLWALIGLSRYVLRSLRRLQGDAWWAHNARFLATVMLMVLVWWNDNVLFGAQTESILACMALGLFVAAVRIGTPDDAEEPAASTAPPALPAIRPRAALG